MATTRVKANFIWGTVGVDLPSTGTTATLTSAGLMTLPSVSAPQVSSITIDPNGVYGAPEIVHVTAHSSTANTATILRAQEGTTRRAHLAANSVEWRQTATKEDWEAFDEFPDNDQIFTAALVVKWDEGRYDPRGFTGAGPAQKLNAALDAAGQDEGGKVTQGSDGTIITIDEPIIVPGGVEFDGVGHRRTIFQPDDDWGVGTYAFDYSRTNPPGVGYYYSLKNFEVRGPTGFAPAFGSRNCDMGGIFLGAQCPMEGVRITYFGDGLILPQSHNLVKNCLFMFNYDGIVYPDFPLLVGTGTEVYTGGDHGFFGGGSIQNKRSSVCSKGSNAMFSVEYNNWKFGYGPIGMLRENGVLASSKAWMSNIQFVDASCESFGNHAFMDIGTGTGDGSLSMADCDLNGLQVVSNNHVSMRDPGITHHATCVLRSMRGMDYKTAHLTFPVPFNGTCVWDFTTAGTISSCRLKLNRQGILNSWATGYASDGGPTFMRYGGSGGFHVDCGDYRLENRYLLSGSVAIGDAVEWIGAQAVRPLTAAGNHAGIAQTEGNAAGHQVMVAHRGERNVPVRLAAACTVGAKLYRVVGTTHQLGPTVPASGNTDVVAIAQQAGSSGALVNATIV